MTRFFSRFAAIFLANLLTGLLATASPWVEFHKDETVTFRLDAPRADSVQLQSWTLPRGPDYVDGTIPFRELNKDEDGTWTVTLDHLNPGDVFEYNYSVDGLAIPDPRNPKRKGPLNSVLVVPSDKPRLWLENPGVPSGTLHSHRYGSPVSGRKRDLVVYTPPGFSCESETPYPLLILLHGAGDNAFSWTGVTGRAHHILDNLISEDRIDPWIVAMPDGHWREDEPEDRTEAILEEIIAGIIPFMERAYPVRQGTDNHAIAGLSMGGGQTSAMLLQRPQSPFAAYGMFSGGLWGPADEVDRQMKEQAETLANVKQPPLIWIACGTRDFAMDSTNNLRRVLDGLDITYQYHEDDSDHNWAAWRDFLPRFLEAVEKQQ